MVTPVLALLHQLAEVARTDYRDDVGFFKAWWVGERSDQVFLQDDLFTQLCTQEELGDIGSRIQLEGLEIWKGVPQGTTLPVVIAPHADKDHARAYSLEYFSLRA